MPTNNFDREIVNIENELLNLKTEKTKKVNSLSVVEYKGTVTFQLEKYQASQTVTRIQSTRTIYIVAEPVMNRGYFCTARIEVTSLDGREVFWTEYGLQHGDTPYVEYTFRIYNSTNAQDIAKINAGQTPEVTYNITITSTTPMDIDWDYYGH